MKIYKGVILMLVILFSLSPCSVKETLLGTVDLEYSSPINQTRATVNQIGGCGEFNAASNALKETVSKRNLKSVRDDFYANLSYNNCRQLCGKRLLSNYSGYTTGNSPPKYILYKRFKSYLA